MKLHFLWRENYVGYLWASNVTTSAYFLHSGFLLYNQEVLTAYATSKELCEVDKFTEHLAGNQEEILNLEKEFNSIRRKIKSLRVIINNKNARKCTNQELYSLFEVLIGALRDYVKVYLWTEPHFTERIEKEAFSLLDIKIGKKRNMERIVAGLLSYDKKMTAKYMLDAKTLKTLYLLNEVAKMRFRAKKISTPLVDLSEILLREASRRTYLAVMQISNLDLKELKELLCRSKQPNLELVNMRQKHFALKINVMRQPIAENISNIGIKRFIQYDQRHADKKIFKGIIVYPGKVSGRARIVPPMSGEKEYKMYISTLKKTDIIVAAMTSPDLTPAFSKVAAVITDEGGLMSHAALVAREKRIPCIIGTKIATRALNNGDRIAVDADNGTVTKKI
jgi:phosphohistidine swiveling domain-containing protein